MAPRLAIMVDTLQKPDDPLTKNLLLMSGMIILHMYQEVIKTRKTYFMRVLGEGRKACKAAMKCFARDSGWAAARRFYSRGGEWCESKPGAMFSSDRSFV